MLQCLSPPILPQGLCASSHLFWAPACSFGYCTCAKHLPGKLKVCASSKKGTYEEATTLRGFFMISHTPPRPPPARSCILGVAEGEAPEGVRRLHRAKDKVRLCAAYVRHVRRPVRDLQVQREAEVRTKGEQLDAGVFFSRALVSLGCVNEPS